jgi:putative addiction module component (TIGR02574 family)
MVSDFSEVFEPDSVENLRLPEELRDNVAAMPEQIPPTDRQKEELRRRKEEYLRNPDSAVPWEVARERIRNRNR